jgi:hypothetical protein
LAGEDQENLKDSLRWAPALKRPTLAIRWGIGIQYTSPRNFTGGPTPIGRVANSSPPSSNPGNGQGGDPNAPQPGAAPLVVLDYYTAELGTKLVDGLRTRIDIGQFGEVQKTYAATTTDPAMAQQASDPNNPAAKAMAGKPKAIVPGVVFLGVERGGAAGTKDLIAKAKKEELDALVVFDINVSPTRTVIANNTKMMLLDLTKGESIHATKLLKNTAVEVARKEARGEDPVDEVIERLFAIVDSTYKLEEFPEALNEANVTTRVQKLTETPPANKLQTLLEIAFWQQRGLISPDTAKIAYEKILGPDGAKLAEEGAGRDAVVQKLLPKGGGVQPGSGKRLGIGVP